MIGLSFSMIYYSWDVKRKDEEGSRGVICFIWNLASISAQGLPLILEQEIASVQTDTHAHSRNSPNFHSHHADSLGWTSEDDQSQLFWDRFTVPGGKEQCLR